MAQRPRDRSAPTALPVAAFPVQADDAKSPVASQGDWEFSLSAGPAVRTLGQVKINSGYRSGGVVLPSLVGTDSLTIPPVGDATAYADREYEDGTCTRYQRVRPA